MRIQPHLLSIRLALTVTWFAIFLLAGCGLSSAHGAGRYFEGDAFELAVASEQGNAKAIRRLMKDKGVNPDVEFSKEGGIPLVAWPLRAKNLEGLRAMLENGADPNARLVQHLQGEEYRHNNAMVYAAQMEDPRFLELLLDHGGDPNTRNSNNETLLFQAFIAGNQWQNVQLLVEKGADVNLGNRWHDDTVISWYSVRGGFEYVHWLLEHGADPTVKAPSPKGADKPERMMIVEEIYWNITTPDLLPWQKKCQQWLIDRGIPRPPMPEHIRKKREAFGFPATEEDIPLL